MNFRRPKYAPVSPTTTQAATDQPDTDEEPSPLAAGNDRAKTARPGILEGDVHRGVLAIAIPSVATMLLQTTNGLLDAFFVGSLGPEALSALTISSSLLFALMSAAFAVSVGTTALVARFIGQGNLPDAVTATKQSLILALLLSLTVALPMYFLREPLLFALGLKDNSHRLAGQYFAMILFGMPSLFLMLVMNGAFRGLGDTVRPFWVSLGANIVHIIFNYLLIFGNFGFPKMGLAGGATALVISQIVASGIYVVFLLRTPLADAFRNGWKIEPEWIKRISRIGIPASVQQLIRVGSMLAFQGLLARTASSDAAIAALGIGLRFESIAFMPGFGYSIAASAFVGQNLGAKQVDRANAGAWAATWQAVTVMTLMGCVFAAAAEPFARLFVQHRPGETPAEAALVNETIALTVTYLRIALWSEPFLALGMVLTGALQGAGETVSPTVITIATMIFIRLPLGYLLLFYWNLPTDAAWWAMSITTIVQGIFTVWLFRRGKWRKTEV